MAAVIELTGSQRLVLGCDVIGVPVWLVADAVMVVAEFEERFGDPHVWADVYAAVAGELEPMRARGIMVDALSGIDRVKAATERLRQAVAGLEKMMHDGDED